MACIQRGKEGGKFWEEATCTIATGCTPPSLTHSRYLSKYAHLPPFLHSYYLLLWLKCAKAGRQPWQPTLASHWSGSLKMATKGQLGPVPTKSQAPVLDDKWRRMRCGRRLGFSEQCCCPISLGTIHTPSCPIRLHAAHPFPDSTHPCSLPTPAWSYNWQWVSGAHPQVDHHQVTSLSVTVCDSSQFALINVVTVKLFMPLGNLF